jgi:hypothetical protein
MPRLIKVSDSKLKSIYGKAVKGGYDASYESFLGDFGNVPEDLKNLQKLHLKKQVLILMLKIINRQLKN